MKFSREVSVKSSVKFQTFSEAYEKLQEVTRNPCGQENLVRSSGKQSGFERSS